MSLMLHCGNKIRTREEVEASATPDPTATWSPTPHITMVDILEDKLPDHGFEITETALSLNNEGTRMFGMMKLQSTHSDYAPVVGFRNAHDKMFSQAICCGSMVFVCDNLAFSSEIVFRRRHTPNIMRDLPGIVDEALAQLGHAQSFQAARIDRYKATEIDDVMAHHIAIRAMKQYVFSPSKVAKVVNEWDNPRHEEFEPRTLWSLFNGVTEILRGGNIWVRAENTQVLHKLCDTVVEELTDAEGPDADEQYENATNFAELTMNV